METSETGEMAGRSRHREPEPTLDFGFDDDVPIDVDPLEPHPEHPTPIDLVLRLTQSERVSRVERLVEMAWNRYDQAIGMAAGRNIAGVCALVSGGNDSYTVGHLFRSVSTHWVHANTGTGIEATRQHVRNTAAAWSIPLIEVHPEPGAGYWDLVRGTVMARSRETGEMVQTWPGGFPGHAAHFRIMYERLKGRGLAQVPHIFGISGSREDQVVFIAGRRRAESKRRATVPHYERKHTTLWSSPMAIWHKADLRVYRLMHHASDCPVPLNPVAQRLDQSGECGCLSNATGDEAARWRAAYPDEPFVQRVNATEEELRPRTDIPEHRKKWGWAGDPVAEAAEDAYIEDQKLKGALVAPDGPLSTPLCGPNCGIDPMFDLMDPFFSEGDAA